MEESAGLKKEVQLANRVTANLRYHILCVVFAGTMSSCAHGFFVYLQRNIAGQQRDWGPGSPGGAGQPHPLSWCKICADTELSHALHLLRATEDHATLQLALQL